MSSIAFATFNLWRGGEAGAADAAASRAATLAALRALDADVMALQEANARTEHYAAELGVRFVEQGGGCAILSRLEVVDLIPGGATIRLQSGAIAHVLNVHLNPKPYQPYQLAGIPYGDGRPIGSAAEAIAEARKARGAEVAALVEAVRAASARGGAVLLAGDFNEPSHLDWTARAAATGRCALAVEWPASRALAAIGMRDAFRSLFPDEIERPGHTWTPRPARREVCDRIDRIYLAGDAAPLAATIVGEAAEHADVTVTPWPSDHRALVVRVGV